MVFSRGLKIEDNLLSCSEWENCLGSLNYTHKNLPPTSDNKTHLCQQQQDAASTEGKYPLNEFIFSLTSNMTVIFV